ncbi:hypothetical protein KQI84_19230 [bacterium]|nr:hypothetical protein [bacterium]
MAAQKTSSPGKKSKWPRRILLAAAVLLIVLCCLVEIILPGMARKRLEGALQEKFGDSARIHGIELNPLSGEIVLNGLVISNPHQFTEPHILAIRSITFDGRILSILGNDVVIDEIKVEEPEIFLERLPDGRRNAVEVLPQLFDEDEEVTDQPDEAAPEEEKKPEPRPKERHRRVTIHRISIEEATFRASDGKSRKYGGSIELAWDDVRIDSITLQDGRPAGEKPVRIRIDNLKLRGPEGFFREPRILWVDKIDAQFDAASLANDRIRFPSIRIQQPIIEQGVDSFGKDNKGRIRRIAKAMFPKDDDEENEETQEELAEAPRDSEGEAEAVTSAEDQPPSPADEQEGTNWEIDELELAMGYWRKSWWTPDGWQDHWLDDVTLSLHGLGSTGEDRPFGLELSAIANDQRGRIEATATGRPLAPPGQRTLQWGLSIDDMLITPLQVDYDIEDEEQPEPPRLENARAFATSEGSVANEQVDVEINLRFDELKFRPHERSLWNRLTSIGEESDGSSWWSGTIERLRLPGEDRTVDIDVVYTKAIEGPKMARAFDGIWTELMNEANRQSVRLARGEVLE